MEIALIILGIIVGLFLAGALAIYVLTHGGGDVE